LVSILIIMVLFVIANLAIGFWSSRNVTSEGFMTAERKMTLSLLMFSTFTTSIGAGDIFSYPSLGYTQGWSSLHFVLAMPVVVILMAFTVGKRYHEMKVRTISDMLCKVYGENKALRVFSSICMSLGVIAWLATQYAGFGKTLNLLTGAPAVLGMFIGALVFISYTVAGGLVSVMAVSIMQGIFLIGGIIIIFFATTAAGGGYAEVQANLPVSYSTFLGPAGAMTITMFWMNKGLSRFTNFAYWQRLGAARSAKSGIWGVALGMAITGILGVVLALIGMAAFKINPGGLADPEMVFPQAAVLYFPKWVTGIILGALWAAILSSAGAFLNSATTLIGNDIWFKAANKEGRDEKTRLKDLKVLTAAIGCLTFFVAWLIPSVLNLLIWAGVWLTPPLIPVLFATIFDKEGKKLPPNWMLASMFASALAGVLFEVVPSLKPMFSGGTIPAFFASLIIVLIGVAAGSVSGKHTKTTKT